MDRGAAEEVPVYENNQNTDGRNGQTDQVSPRRAVKSLQNASEQSGVAASKLYDFDADSAAFSSASEAANKDGHEDATYRDGLPAQRVVENRAVLLDAAELLGKKYGTAELDRLVAQYCDAYYGIYGVIDASMSEDEATDIYMKYLEEICADAYAQIRRGGINIAKAEAAMECVTSSILQGKSIKGISDDLQRYIPTMSRDSAIRAARTAVTGAQNAGRMDSYAAAAERGISLKREWVATLDNRTRHAHAMLDGTKVGMNEPFKVDGYKIMFPGDRSAPGYLIYNCRCTMVAAVDGIDTSDAMRRACDPETGESVLIKNMTYREWQSWKASEVAAGYAKDDAATLKFFGADARDDLKSIVKRRTMKLKNGFACFPDDDVLSGYVQKVTPLKTYFDVAMHGSPTAVGFGTTETNMSPRMLASVIRHSDGWNGQKIRLLSCSTGKQLGDDYCFAEELANALGVEVKAPDDILLITPSGRMSVGLLGKGGMVSYIPNQRGRRK